MKRHNFLLQTPPSLANTHTEKRPKEDFLFVGFPKIGEEEKTFFLGGGGRKCLGKRGKEEKKKKWHHHSCEERKAANGVEKRNFEGKVEVIIASIFFLPFF